MIIYSAYNGYQRIEGITHRHIWMKAVKEGNGEKSLTTQYHYIA